jgi:hypothetical protein
MTVWKPLAVCSLSPAYVSTRMAGGQRIHRPFAGRRDRIREHATIGARRIRRSTAPRTRRTEREWVVDDNEDAARLLGEVLTQEGYHTRVALDAPAALRRQWNYDPRSRSCVLVRSRSWLGGDLDGVTLNAGEHRPKDDAVKRHHGVPIEQSG